MKKINLHKQFKQLTNATDRIIKEGAMGFRADIISAWPVALIHSQDSKGKWSPIIQIVGGYKVANTATYSPILWKGRHTIGNQEYGSYQMEAGGVPILNKTLSIIRQRMKYL